jgi:hypothetical protein
MVLPDSKAQRVREGARIRREVLVAAYVEAGKQPPNTCTERFIVSRRPTAGIICGCVKPLSRKTRGMPKIRCLRSLVAGTSSKPTRGALKNTSPRRQ